MGLKADLTKILQYSDSDFIRRLFDYIDISDSAGAIKALVRLRARDAQAIELLTLLAKHEVEQTITDTELFRRNSLASKFTAQYIETMCLPFLQEVLAAPISQIISESSSSSYEVDPLKMGSHCHSEGEGHSHDALCENQDRLKRGAQLIFESILESAARSPEPLKITCLRLRQCVEAKFPNLCLPIVGGLLFLRFWIPAVTSPEGFKVVKGPIPDSSRRALILIAKILQSLTNGVELGQKEEYLAPLNCFVTENMAKMTQYLDQISSSSHSSLSEPELDGVDHSAEINEVYACFHRNKQRLAVAQTDKMDPNLGAMFSKVIVLINTYPPPPNLAKRHSEPAIDLDVGVFGFFPTLRLIGADGPMSPEQRKNVGELGAIVSVAVAKTEPAIRAAVDGRRTSQITGDNSPSPTPTSKSAQPTREPTPTTPMTGSPVPQSPKSASIISPKSSPNQPKSYSACPIKGSGKLSLREGDDDRNVYAFLESARLDFYRMKDLTLNEGKVIPLSARAPKLSVLLDENIEAIAYPKSQSLELADLHTHKLLATIIFQNDIERTNWTKCINATMKWTQKSSMPALTSPLPVSSPSVVAKPTCPECGEANAKIERLIADLADRERQLARARQIITRLSPEDLDLI